MKKSNQRKLYISACMLAIFVIWTLAVRFLDVASIGPQNSSVGFATVNQFVHKLTGVHMALYNITDWLSVIPLGIVLGFALLGLIQWIRRKRLSRVDYSIFILGGFYIVVMAIFLFFEKAVVNYRPVLIEGVLEASYPSSTTMLVMCVMPTAILQLRSRIKNKGLRYTVCLLMAAFTVFMVSARLISGVHWFTDIVGGAMLSTGLVLTYAWLIGLKQK